MELDELEDVPEPGLAKVITRAYQTDTYLSSKASTVVAEANGQVVGVVFGYPSENEDDINNVLINLSKKSADFKAPYIPDSETNSDEWYLDSIAVDPDWQGHGIGSKLLAAVPRMALMMGSLWSVWMWILKIRKQRNYMNEKDSKLLAPRWLGTICMSICKRRLSNQVCYMYNFRKWLEFFIPASFLLSGYSTCTNQ